MKFLSTYEFEIKKSKFIGFAFYINNEEEFRYVLENIKKEHRKSKHICYGYKLNNTKIKTFDDGEPRGTASIPLLNALQNENVKVNNIALFVVRYFGGIKLGKGGLYRSYFKCSLETLKLIKMV